MKIIFLGAPGAGKGTQAELVSEKLKIPAISTGAIIRAAIKGGTEMGLKARAFTERGELVPDEVVIGIIKERLAEDDCKRGFILDGFPRTVPQAQALDEMGVSIDLVVEIEVEDSRIVDRMLPAELPSTLSTFPPRTARSVTDAERSSLSVPTICPRSCLIDSRYITSLPSL